jgi:hypothetical protein
MRRADSAERRGRRALGFVTWLAVVGMRHAYGVWVGGRGIERRGKTLGCCGGLLLLLLCMRELWVVDIGKRGVREGEGSALGIHMYCTVYDGRACVRVYVCVAIGSVFLHFTA